MPFITRRINPKTKRSAHNTYFDLGVHRTSKENMPGHGKQLHLLYALGVARVRVHDLLGDVALLGHFGRAQILAQILRYVQEGAAHVVVRARDMQRRLGLLLLRHGAPPHPLLPLGQQLVDLPLLLGRRLRDQHLVLVVGPRAQVALHVTGVVVALAATLVLGTDGRLCLYIYIYMCEPNMEF